MIKRLYLFLFAFVSILSCGKDSIESTPKLTFLSVSSTLINPGDGLEVLLRLTDKEGDFKDTIWVQKVTTRCPSSNFKDSLLYRIPADVPSENNFDAEVSMIFSYALELQPRCTRPDTAVFSFWMKDQKGNVSDTARTPPIIILRP
jgi:hypothetical protein